VSGRCAALPFPILLALVLLDVVLLAGAGGGCASHDYVVRSDHFQITIPRTWQVVRAPGPADGPAIVRVPAAHNPAGGADTALDLYFFPWLERRPIAQPTQEAFRRLVADDQLNLKTAGPPDTGGCASLINYLSLFGVPQPVIHVETPTGDHIVLAAGQSQGSLVAVAGVVPGGARSCRDVLAMQNAMDSLATLLVGMDVADRPPPPRAEFAPDGRHPAPELPPQLR
jgi:hypothetical protein